MTKMTALGHEEALYMNISQSNINCFLAKKVSVRLYAIPGHIFILSQNLQNFGEMGALLKKIRPP